MHDDKPYMYEDNPYMYEDNPYMYEDNPYMYDDIAYMYDDIAYINDDMTYMYEYHIHVWYHVIGGGFRPVVYDKYGLVDYHQCICIRNGVRGM